MIQKAYNRKKKFSKKREDRTPNTILYCSTAGCAETFDETLKLQEHMLSGKRVVLVHNTQSNNAQFMHKYNFLCRPQTDLQRGYSLHRIEKLKDFTE